MSRQLDASTQALRAEPAEARSAEPKIARGALRACLFASAFTAGFAITGIEIALGRLLAPHFGSSLAVWAAIMAAIIGSLALGYPLGGWLADRRPGPRLPFAALLIGASISALLSTPVTRSPAEVSGMARRPVPTPSSNTSPWGANERTTRTVASTSVTSAYQSS